MTQNIFNIISENPQEPDVTKNMHKSTMHEDRGYKIKRNIYNKKAVFNNSQKNKIENERFKNISEMYYLPDNNINKYSGKVYLIDDIYTTGSTINYGAKLLKKAGFDNVAAVTFFRTVLNNI